MKHKRLLSLILFLLSFGPTQWLLLAQEIDTLPAKDSLTSQVLEEVVVTARRYESLQLNTPEAIKALASESIQDFQLRSSPEALVLTPGVFVQKTNHGGGSPFLRGLTGNQTLLLLDGIRLSNATMRYGPNQYVNTIDVFSIDKFEVLRGSGSVQYGSDAIGGTIQAFSQTLDTSQERSWEGKLIARLATQGMEQGMHGRINYSDARVALSGGITARNFGDMVGGDTTGIQTPSGYGELDFDLKGKLILSPRSDLTMLYQHVHQKDVPVYHKVVLEDYAVNKMDPQKRQLAYARLNHRFLDGVFKSATFTASYQQVEEGRELLKNGSPNLRTESDQLRSWGFSAETQTSNGVNWSANTGLEITHDLVKSSRIDLDLSNDSTVTTRGLYPDGATMTSLAVFTVHSYNLQSWSLTAGARFNSYLIQVDDEALGKTQLTPSALVGNLAILRKLNRTSHVFISLNTGFRAPNINDLGTLGIVDFRYETPNFDLQPEYSFQVQLGYKYRGNKFKGDIYLYRNELYNLIVRRRIEGDSLEGYPVYQKENNGRAYIQGMETDWHYAFHPSWLVGGSLTYTYGQNLTKEEPMRRIPPLFGRLYAEYGLKGWWLSLEWKAAGKQDRLSGGDVDDNRIPPGGTPSWNIVNMHASYAWRLMKVNLSLKNLFNEDYRYHGSGINGYGRSAWLSVMLIL
jgi:hemoglobin/transferrin/lactoferrin receptor protein